MGWVNYLMNLQRHGCKDEIKRQSIVEKNRSGKRRDTREREIHALAHELAMELRPQQVVNELLLLVLVLRTSSLVLEDEICHTKPNHTRKSSVSWFLLKEIRKRKKEGLGREGRTIVPSPSDPEASGGATSGVWRSSWGWGRLTESSGEVEEGVSDGDLGFARGGVWGC
jgi:hypothetical protein